MGNEFSQFRGVTKFRPQKGWYGAIQFKSLPISLVNGDCLDRCMISMHTCNLTHSLVKPYVSEQTSISHCNKYGQLVINN